LRDANLFYLNEIVTRVDATVGRNAVA